VTLGPLMVDIAGSALGDDDRKVLEHPLVGGVILFSRNFESVSQLKALTADIHALKTPPLLIAVDHEGGRVQRFHDGFTPLPTARSIGGARAQNRALAAELAEAAGWLAASELAAAGVDFSFAPVVDLDTGASEVIGDRAFSNDPQVVVELARAWIEGARRAGQIDVAKHFPGHGSVRLDSHVEVVRDSRGYAAIAAADLVPFEHMAEVNVAAMMMAHVVYAAVDDEPASLSRRWIDGELRQRLGYDGAVFCDDLSMRGVAALGDILDIAHQALAAGCDMLPICNDRPAVERLLGHGRPYDNPNSGLRLTRLHARPRHEDQNALRASDRWQKSRRFVAGFVDRNAP
jgi:beta-N-acetylhexosaminidase